MENLYNDNSKLFQLDLNIYSNSIFNISKLYNNFCTKFLLFHIYYSIKHFIL